MTGIDGSTPAIDQALLPANVRGASKERRAEYTAALSFERSLVSQMTESMMKTASVGSDDKDVPAAIKAMKENMPATLTDAIMNSGGLGLAAQLDASWHPDENRLKTSLSDQPAASGGATAPGAAASSASAGGASA